MKEGRKPEYPEKTPGDELLTNLRFADDVALFNETTKQWKST